MSVRKISHIGIAVRDLEQATAVYRGLMGLEPAHVEEVADQHVRVALFEVGESRVELLCPTSPKSPIARFLDKHGEGLHHVAYEVEDLETALTRLREQGVELIDERPRRGADGMLIAFLHPRSACGVLTELCQPGKLPLDGNKPVSEHT